MAHDRNYYMELAAKPMPDYKTSPREYAKWRYARIKLGMSTRICAACAAAFIATASKSRKGWRHGATSRTK